MCCQGGLVEAEAPRNVLWSCKEASPAASLLFSNPCALHLVNDDSYCNDNNDDDHNEDDYDNEDSHNYISNDNYSKKKNEEKSTTKEE
jgi:hypothetical protein